MTITKHLIIHGRVQGVWYRAWSVKTATELGLSGWVRNKADGTVEAVVHGPEGSVQAFIEACYKGPEYADVTKIESADATYDGPEGFKQRA